MLYLKEFKNVERMVFGSFWQFIFKIIIGKHLWICVGGIAAVSLNLWTHAVIANDVAEKLINTVEQNNLTFFDNGALYWLGCYLFVFIIAEIFNYCGKYIYSQFALIEKEIRVLCFSFLKKVNIEYFSSNKEGSIENTIDNLSEGTREFLEDCVCDIIPSVIFSFLVASYLFSLNYEIGLLYTGGIVLYFMIYSLFADWIITMGKKAFKAVNNRTGVTIEVLQNFKLSKIIDINNYILNKIEHVSDDEATLIRRYFLLNANFGLICGILLLFLNCGIIAFTIHYLSNSLDLNSGKLVKIIGILFNVSACLFNLSKRMMDFLLNYSRIAQSLNKIHNMPAEEFQKGFSNIRWNNININNLSIDFGDKVVMENINLEIKKGEKVCVMGPSGCGKTSLLNMICKITPINKGSIFVGGVDINNINHSEYKDNISYITQKSYMFHGSILENITLGRPNLNLEKVHNICKKLLIHDFIESLPRGYHSNMGINGSFISGGQGQRIRLARDLLNEGDCIVCDEATSSLDAITGIEVIKNIFALSEGKTLIWVDHSNLVAQFCDKVILFDGKGGLEIATHEELLKSNKSYQTIFRHHIT